jgi:hypothetical protein
MNLEALKEKKKEIAKLKAEAQQMASDAFDSFCKEIFEKHPKVESFGWSQYTPYFNDGDTCTFSANTDYISINGEYVDDSKWINEKTVTDWGTWNRDLRIYEGRVEVPNLDYDPELSKGADEITEFLRNFDNDFYITRFGDHAEITVSKDGVDVDEYEHD